MKALRAVFIAAALIVMALPCALMSVMPSTLGAENRLPAEWPQLITNGKFNVNFPDQYEAWLQDHVALRSLWIGLHSRILRLLGTSSQEMVVLGKEDWLFYRDMLNDYTGAEPLSDDEVARMALVLDTVDAGLKAQGSSLTVAIIPNKGTIYPEKMLDAYPHSTLPSTFERLKEASHVRYVPVYEALSEKAGEGLYFHGDVHWNGLGARLGTSTILSTLSEALGQQLSSPDPEAEYEVREDWPGDLTRMLDPYSTECEPQQYYDDEHSFSYKKRPRSPEDLTINTNGGKADVNLLVLRDSFTNQMLEYIADAAKSVTFLRAMPLPLKNTSNYDAVLLEMVERRLPELLNAPPDMPAPTTEAPGDLLDASIVGMRLEIDGTRLFGALEEVPTGITQLSVGIRKGPRQSWYSGFPVSGVEEDGDRGFSALLDAIPNGAEVCVYMKGDTAMCTEWTPVSSAIVPEAESGKGTSGEGSSEGASDGQADDMLQQLMAQKNGAQQDDSGQDEAPSGQTDDMLQQLMAQKNGAQQEASDQKSSDGKASEEQTTSQDDMLSKLMAQKDK